MQLVPDQLSAIPEEPTGRKFYSRDEMKNIRYPSGYGMSDDLNQDGQID